MTDTTELIARLRNACSALLHSAQADGVIERKTAIWAGEAGKEAADALEALGARNAAADTILANAIIAIAGLDAKDVELPKAIYELKACADRAEARMAELERALTEIANATPSSPKHHGNASFNHVQRLARAALKETDDG